ncbi:MAG: tetratricopeptide repeat protein [Acidobacteriota bacterium]|nr:tetratricopeptide repeat protein [Acidobacteriota bacterium]
MIGQTVSHYRILEPLGEGGMGTVYLAEDTHLGRRVAIKFPSVNSDSHDYRARFLREARAVSELNHPCIATLFDYGETKQGRPFLVMELAKGRPLADLMQKGELSLSRAVTIVTEVAMALVEAHARGVVHRDIKPSNIMIDDGGQVKVLDFGLAKQLNKDHILSSEPEAQTLLSTETRSGVVLGTPAYLSPEQAVGSAVDGRSDLFSLGTLLYEAITGRTPFAGNSFIEIAANVLHIEPAPPSKINAIVPRELDFITLKALAKKPNKRYQSAREMIADLNAVKEQLEEASGHTLIKRTSPSAIAAHRKTLNSLAKGTSPLAIHNKTLSDLSAILQRPRIPISYILIGVVILITAGGLALRFGRTSPHLPPAEAQRWYDIGTGALRDGAFYQATQALQRAITSDDGYMLARARLAEALVELDYVDRAKDELLRVNATERATLPKLDALYLDAITATARRDFAKAIELYKQIVGQVADAEKAYVLVDLGRAYENNNDVKDAIQSYKDASTRNSQYATAYLHLGILYGQQGDLAAALSALDQAESIYQALGNLEGRAEVSFQRGALFNNRNKLSEARAQLEQALTLAKANDNKSQTIKTLLQLCSVAFDGGETARSTEYAQEAVELARKNGMENLSTRGLVDLGYSFLVRGKQAEAERYLEQALDSAQRGKAKRNEARARSAMASLRQQQGRSDEAVQYLEPALAFYQQGGYRSEAVSCLFLLARVNFQRGDYPSAAKSQEELLQLTQQLNDQALIARAHAERGSGLVREEKFTEALDHLNQAYAIYSSQGIQRSMGHNLVTRGDVEARLGHFDRAQALLDQGIAIADKPGGEIKRLSLDGKLVFAKIALTQGNFADARSKAQKIFEAAGSEFKGTATDAKIVMGLAQSYGGATAAGKQAATEAFEMAKQLNDPAQVAMAQMALAEAQLLSGDSRSASGNALQADDIFARLGQPASEWRALVIAAQASQKLGDKSKAHEYAMRARDSLSKLEQRWGSENYNSYLSRPDVQRFRKQLDQLGASV